MMKKEKKKKKKGRLSTKNELVTGSRGMNNSLQQTALAAAATQ
jgi:hypothetical protein